MSKKQLFIWAIIMVLSLTYQVKAAELFLVCPCQADRIGQTAVKITVGVINKSETESGELRIILKSAKSPTSKVFYIQAYRYFSETLKPGSQFSAETKQTVAFRLPQGESFNDVGKSNLHLGLEEKVNGEWLTKDSVRLGEPLNFPNPPAGGESPGYRIFLEGQPWLEKNGSQSTLRIPKIVNQSPETVILEEISILQFPSKGFFETAGFYGFKQDEDNPSIILQPNSQIKNIEVKGQAFKDEKGYPFKFISLDNGDGISEVWETIEAREGNVISVYPFTANSIDFLADSDGDGVSDFNENLAGTHASDANSQPGTVIIDVMALYTPAVDEKYNGEPEVRILHEIEWGNQALRNSKINARFRLVKTQSVNYQGLDTQVAIAAVKNEIGVFEGIDAVREEVGADLLALYIEKDPDTEVCGLASLIASGKDGDLASNTRNGIVAVVAKGASGCRTSNLTHEFGHNFGLGHDVREVTNSGTFGWSRGHGVDGLLSTIMAYEDGYGYFGPELQYFSNPDISCNGQPCGVDKSDLSLGADAALSIRTTMYQIARLSGDSDADGTNDKADNCPLISNASQLDTDGDSAGDACDEDDDGDGVLDSADAFPLDASETLDSDNDGVGDNVDTFPLDASEQVDTDDDGVGDNTDAFPSDATKNVYNCADTSFVPKLASDSTLSFEKRLVVANPASNSKQQTFLRFVNPSDEPVQVQLYGIDDNGTSGGLPISFTLSANESKQMTAQDLENGNTSKGLKTFMCDGAGKWQITARSSKAIEIMGLIRTPDGFLTGLTDPVPVESGSNIVYFANPASSTKQQTFLRIVNNSSEAGTVTITAIDNLGVTATEVVSFELGANGSKQMTAQDLENGNAAKELTGKLGDGTGKWRLTIASPLSLSVQSLIRTPDGFLTNMSAVVTPNSNGSSTVSFLNPASNTAQQSFIRLINTGAESSSITISALDDVGQISPNGHVLLTLAAGKSLELSASDLEQGNANLQLNGSLGVGSGRWRLNVSSQPKIKVMSYVLTSTGFLTNMSEVAGAASYRNTVWIFNPGSNSNQASKLRVINNGQDDAAVTITGIDDEGNAGRGSDLTFNLPYNSVKEVTAAELEKGSSVKGLAGGIGDGKGKWRLTVSSDEPVTVQSLLETPAGFITNLSTSAQ